MKNITFTEQNVTEYFIYSLFLLPLFGTSIPAYIFAIGFLMFHLQNLRFKLQDVFFLLIILLWFVAKTFQSDFNSCLILLRYYFGFYIFYLYFSNAQITFKLDKLLWVISIVVIIEAVLINTILPAQFLANYATTDIGDLVAETKIFGFYQRPYSIGSNSTITSTLVMVLIYYVFGFAKNLEIKKNNKLLVVSIFSVIILGSGTGYVLLILFFIYKIKPFKNWLLGIVSAFMLFFIYYLIFIYDLGAIDGLDKISKLYILLLYELKFIQINEVLIELNHHRNSIFIGRYFQNAQELIIWSDFSWLNLLECTGYVGLVTILLFFLTKINTHNYVPIIVFLIGALHYGAIYSLPGQLLIGYFMSSKFIKDENKCFKDLKTE